MNEYDFRPVDPTAAQCRLSDVERAARRLELPNGTYAASSRRLCRSYQTAQRPTPDGTLQLVTQHETIPCSRLTVPLASPGRAGFRRVFLTPWADTPVAVRECELAWEDALP